MSQHKIDVRCNGIVKFLEEYKKFPCLWKRSDPYYRHRLMREAAEKSLLQSFKFPSTKELKKKIKSIRGTYRQERNRVRTSMATAKGSKDIYRPQLIWYDLADSFLRLNENESESNVWEKAVDGIRDALKQKDSSFRHLGTGKKNQNSLLLLKVTNVKDCPPTDTQIEEEVTTPEPSTSQSQPTASQSSPSTNCTNQIRKKEEGVPQNQRKIIKLDGSLKNAVIVLKKVTSQSLPTNESANLGSPIASPLQTGGLGKLNVKVTKVEDSPSPLTDTQIEEEIASPEPSTSQSQSQLTSPFLLNTNFVNKKRKREEDGPQRKIANLDDSLQEAVEVLKKVSSQSQSTNEFTTFGSHVASQLQALPLITALQLQSEIHSLITSVRLECLRKTSSSRSEIFTINCSTKEDSLHNKDRTLCLRDDLICNENISDVMDGASGKTIPIATHFSSYSKK